MEILYIRNLLREEIFVNYTILLSGKNSHDFWLSCSQQEIHRRYKDPENVRMLALIFAKAFGIAKIKGLLINFFYMVVAS